MLYTIAIDQGTTSTRAILFDESFRTIACHRERIKLHTDGQLVEQDPHEIVNSVKKCLRRMLKHTQSTDTLILGLANQRESIVALDAQFEPCSPVISWMDPRRSDKTIRKELQSITGLPVTSPYPSAHKIALLARDSKAKYFATIDAYIIKELFGTFMTDVTNASRTMLMDLKKGEWDKDCLSSFGVSSEALPTIHDFSKEPLDSQFEGRQIGLAAVLGDQHAALYCHKQLQSSPNWVKCTYGTGCFLMKIATEPIDSMLFTRAFDDLFAVEAPLSVGAATLEWVTSITGKSHESIRELSRDRLLRCEAHFVPALTGALAPFWLPDVRGAFLNLSLCDGDELVAAVALAMLFSVRLATEPFDAFELCVDGGLSNSDVLMQLQADILGTKVVRPVLTECTALGVAMQAYRNYTKTNVPKQAELSRNIFEPQLSDLLESKYQTWKSQVYRHLQ